MAAPMVIRIITRLTVIRFTFKVSLLLNEITVARLRRSAKNLSERVHTKGDYLDGADNVAVYAGSAENLIKGRLDQSLMINRNTAFCL